MAQLIGGLGTSHIPAIGNAIHKGLQNEPYWKPFFDGFPPIRQWLGERKPDVVVMFWPELLPRQDAHLCRGRGG